MRICLNCGGHAVSDDWQCSCGWNPPLQDGFRSFAPDLASENDGFGAEAHESLDALQDQSFWFRARNRLIADLVHRHFAGAQSALEVGCGTGYVLQALRRSLPDAVIDGSEIYLNGLSRAKSRLQGPGELFQMDARRIPFEAEFDLICAFDVLEHIDEDENVLAEIARAVKPGGGAIFSVPQHPWLWSRNDDIAFHKRRYRPGELEAKCRRVGFTVEFSSSFVTSLLPIMALQRATQANARTYDPNSALQLPAVLNRLFEAALDMERKTIGMGLRLPWGGSRFVVARKRADLQ